MRKILTSMYGLSPYPELFLRRVYYSHEIFKSIWDKRASRRRKGTAVTIIPGLFNEIIDYLYALGIKNGDILIVHSSMNALGSTGVTPQKIIEILLDLVGKTGTLVMPAYSLLRTEMLENGEGVPVYDPRKSLCWTGLLPNIFLRYPNVVRSEFPYNSLAAKGFHAREMMKENLSTDLAHGKGSAWEYCLNHKAKILFLGVKSSESTTMVHAAEDLMDDEWPVKNWYEKNSLS